MDPPHRTLLLCLLLCSWVAVFSNRLSGNAGVTCCQRILQSQLSKAQLKVLKSYVHLPSHAACSEYLQFTTYAGQSFCVSLREGWVQEMKDTVDSRSKGPTAKDRPSTGSQTGAKEQAEIRKGTPRPAPVSTSATQGHKETRTSSSSVTALPGQERTPALPSMPPSPTSAPQGHKATPSSSSSVTALHGQERTPALPSMPPSPTSAPQGHKATPSSSSSVTALHGQERTTTLQSTPRPFTRALLPPQEDVGTRETTKETPGTSLHPGSIVVTSRPNKHEEGEDKTTGFTYNPSSTMTAHGGPRQGDQVEPQVGIGLYPGDSDKERGSSGEADRATKGQWLKLGLILVTAVLLLAAAIALVSVKLKKRPAVVVELIRYSAYSDARDGAV
ncbi:polycystin-1-like protein 3 isoform X1 [Heptranchias perlo]|uniref:polycystin-1-like protein 3 isoform X1 n=1 Tax=Heptranchias perlo TaxID=212740 RepID=UPI00355A22AD